MGKVKRQKQKLHAAAVKVKDGNTSATSALQDVDMETPSLPLPSGNDTALSSLFSGIDIPEASLVQKLPEFDARSTVTSKSLRGLNKKEKKTARREQLMQKLEVTRKMDKARAEKKKRQETPVVGDMSLMQEALPTLELLMKTSQQKDSDTSSKKKGIATEKSRQKQRLKDIETFGKIMSDTTFQANPFETIQEHLRNKLLQGSL